MSWEEYLKGLEKISGSLQEEDGESTPAPDLKPAPKAPPRDEVPMEESPVPTVPGWLEKGEDREDGPEEGSALAGSLAPESCYAGSGEEGGKPAPPWRGRGRGASRKSRALQKKSPRKKAFTGEEKLLILDLWKRSGLGATDFAPLVGISPHTLYAWRKKLEEDGPEALFGPPRGPSPGSRVDGATRRAILVIKESDRDYGAQRISDILYRGPGLGVSASAVNRVLKEEGYESVSSPVKRHQDKVRRFERAKPNQLWQSDLFTFVLKRQNQRVHLVGFLDDHSRFMTGFGLASRASTGFVLDVVRSAIGAWGPPEEMLTDRGPQYFTWRGKSAFSKEMEKRGIRQIVARARHPRTLGKIERFWGTLWRECLEKAVFLDLADARRRIAFFADHYNFLRPHQGIGGMCPADRFFSAGSQVRGTLEARVARNALELARHGTPRKTFYLTGRVGDVGISLHAEGEKVVMTTQDGKREEVDLRAGGKRAEEGAPQALPEPVSPAGPPAGEGDGREAKGPGESPLDDILRELDSLGEGEVEGEAGDEGKEADRGEE